MEPNLFRVKKDWRHILRHAWSSKIIVLAGLLTGVQFLLTAAWEMGLLAMRPWYYPIVMGVLMGAALTARILAQKDFEG